MELPSAPFPSYSSVDISMISVGSWSVIPKTDGDTDSPSKKLWRYAVPTSRHRFSPDRSRPDALSISGTRHPGTTHNESLTQINSKPSPRYLSLVLNSRRCCLETNGDANSVALTASPLRGSYSWTSKSLKLSARLFHSSCSWLCPRPYLTLRNHLVKDEPRERHLGTTLGG